MTEIFSMDTHDCDNEEDDSAIVNCSTPYRGLNLITHAVEWVNANSLSSPALEINSKPARNENQVTGGDLEPREFLPSIFAEVLKKQDHGDLVARLASFDPASIVGYVRELGQSPKGGVYELEFQIAKAQLLAFSCWRSYSQLPGFSVLSGNLRFDVDAVVLEENYCSSELSDDAPPGFECYRLMRDLMGSLNNSQVSIVRVDEHIASRAASFCSTRLVEYLRGLGGSPCGEVDESELAVAKTQLLAFTNWKGYSQLPEFTFLNGYLASDTYLGILGYKNCSALIADAPVGSGGNESTHAVKRDLDGQTEPRKRPYKTVGCPLISPAACLEPTKLVSYLKVLGVSPYEGLGGTKLKYKEAKAQLSAFSCWKGFSHLPEFTLLSGHLSEENLSGKLIEDAIPCNNNYGNHNFRTIWHTLQGQTDVWEKSNDRLGGEVVCTAACFDTMLYDHLGDNPGLELMRQDYCCNDLFDDAPPGFEQYHMISNGQINLNEKLNGINAEKIVCTAPCFDNVKLIGYLRTLSKSPLEQLCESDLTEAKTQLQAFFSWKGCSRLPEFTTYCGSQENVTEMGFPDNGTCESQLIGGPYVCFGDKDGIDDVRSTSQNQSTNLREMKQVSDGTINPQKRKNRSSFLSDENRSQKLKEEIVCNIPCSDHMVLLGVLRTLSESQLGESELSEANKVSSKLDEMALESSDEYHSESSGNKRTVESSYDDHGSSKSRRTLIREHACGELLSELLCTATNPLEGLDLSVPIVSFFSQFKDSVASGSSGLMEPVESPEHASISEISSTLKSSGSIEPAGLSYPKDSCSSSPVVEEVPEQQLVRNNQDAWNVLLQVSREEAYPSSEQQILTANMASGHDNIPGKPGGEVGETTNNAGKDFGEADYQTALVLTFNNMAAVPPEGYLNKVFGCFGQLNEQETKIFNKRNGCRVVYRKHADAEAAFTSVGKHGMFRDTLCSYRLKYIHPKPAKAPTRRRRQKNDSASYTLGGIQSPITLVGL